MKNGYENQDWYINYITESDKVTPFHTKNPGELSEL